MPAGLADHCTHDKIKGVIASLPLMCRAEYGVQAEWAPDGRLLLIATTAPRLRVDNGITLYAYHGALLAKQPYQVLAEQHCTCAILLIHSAIHPAATVRWIVLQSPVAGQQKVASGMQPDSLDRIALLLGMTATHCVWACQMLPPADLDRARCLVLYVVLCFCRLELAACAVQVLLDASWRPAKIGTYPDRPSSPGRTAGAAGGATANGKGAATGPAAKPAQGYVPPQLRDQAGAGGRAMCFAYGHLVIGSSGGNVRQRHVVLCHACAS